MYGSKLPSTRFQTASSRFQFQPPSKRFQTALQPVPNCRPTGSKLPSYRFLTVPNRSPNGGSKRFPNRPPAGSKLPRAGSNFNRRPNGSKPPSYRFHGGRNSLVANRIVAACRRDRSFLAGRRYRGYVGINQSLGCHRRLQGRLIVPGPRFSGSCR